MGRVGIIVVGVVLCVMLGGAEGNVQFLWYPVQVTPPTATTYLRRTPGKSVHFQVRNPQDGSYHFGYDADTLRGDKSFREEQRDAFGRVQGSYGFVDPEGTLRIVEYVADENGYRTRNSNQQPVGVPLQMYREPLQVIGPLSVIGPIPKPFSEFFKF